MNYAQIEASLGSLKGEESVFRLYREGKQEELKEINKVFMKTKLDDVSRFDNMLANAKNTHSSVIGVYGGKGFGKSTLVSTATLNHLMSGDIDDLKYIRYDPTSQRFKEIFSIEKENPSSRVTVVDDMHYFVPDCINGILVKGSIQCFDRFVCDLSNINKMFRNRNLNSTLVYVSDTHSSTALQKFLDGVLSVADRNDLVRLLPKCSNNSQIMVDRDFYGKTYSILGGNVKTYTAANIFGKIMKEENPNIVDSPRLLKQVIKFIKPHGSQINYKIFANEEVATGIVKGRLLTREDIVKYMYKDASEQTTDFLWELENIRSSTSNQLSSLETELSEPRNVIEKEFEKITESLTESENLVDNTERKTLGDKPYVMPLNRNFNERWKNNRRKAESMHKIILGSYEKVKRHNTTFSSSAKKIENSLRNNGKNLENLDKQARSLAHDYERRMENIGDTLNYYNNLLSKPQRLGSYQKVYAKVKKSAEDFVAANSILFSTTDTSQIKDMIENPRQVINRINPHTIDLIRNLHIIPY